MASSQEITQPATADYAIFSPSNASPIHGGTAAGPASSTEDLSSMLLGALDEAERAPFEHGAERYLGEM